MQIRSRLQHSWAMAVETLGTFLRQPLKASQGEEPWLRFFSLMGSVMAIKERRPLVPGTPSDRKELVAELRKAVHTLKVEDHLMAYGAALETTTDEEIQGATYFLLDLDANRPHLEITGYKEEQLSDAMDKYLEREQAIKNQPNTEVVLVEVKSLIALRRAYPSYFLDSRVFLHAVEEAIQV